MQSNLVDHTLSVLIVALMLLVFIQLEIKITVIYVAVMYAIGRIIVATTVGIYWKKIYLPSKKKYFVTSKLLKTAIPLFFVSASSVVLTSSDLIMLGWLSSSDEVGLFAVASRIALITSFFFAGYKFRSFSKDRTLYHKNAKDELEKMIQKVTGLLFVIGILAFCILIFLENGY